MYEIKFPAGIIVKGNNFYGGSRGSAYQLTLTNGQVLYFHAPFESKLAN